MSLLPVLQAQITQSVSFLHSHNALMRLRDNLRSMSKSHWAKIKHNISYQSTITYDNKVPLKFIRRNQFGLE